MTESFMTSAPTDTRPYHHGDLHQALIDAALVLVKEEQNWDFSLREVARRAGVSHNAPYNHFGEKRELLGAVAAVGFNTLRSRIIDGIMGIDSARSSLQIAAHAYVTFAMENIALYRLMFGAALLGSDGTRPPSVESAGYEAKSVLEDIILRGARSAEFSVNPEDPASQAMATLTCWSALHGLTTLIADAKIETSLPLAQLIDGLMSYILNGLKMH
jgi:AcrR family transcriptional regulator